jgi:hypothetical protein
MNQYQFSFSLEFKMSSQYRKGGNENRLVHY